MVPVIDKRTRQQRFETLDDAHAEQIIATVREVFGDNELVADSVAKHFFMTASDGKQDFGRFWSWNPDLTTASSRREPLMADARQLVSKLMAYRGVLRDDGAGASEMAGRPVIKGRHV